MGNYVEITVQQGRNAAIGGVICQSQWEFLIRVLVA
jgi:hypothetical protein